MLIKKFKRHINEIIGLPIIFILIGIYLRTWNFWKHLFSPDESLQATRAVSVARGIVDLISFNNPSVALKNIFFPILQHNHPPIEFLMSVPFVIFEPREFFMRSIYILFCVLSLVLFYLLLSKIKNKRFGLYFLILYSTSMYSVWWDRLIFHISLGIIAGVFLGIAIINFIKRHNDKSFIWLVIATTLAMNVMIDFAVFLPILIYLVYRYHRYISKEVIKKSLLISSLIIGLYYIPYILYSTFPTSSHSAGFNYYWYGVVSNNLNSSLFSRLLEYLGYFKSDFLFKTGVFPIWIFALFSLSLRKKYKYIPIFFAIIFLYIFINTFFYTTHFYHKNFYGLVLLLGCEWLYSKKRLGLFLLIITLVVNLYGSKPLFEGVYNANFNVNPKEDNVDKIGLYAKNCLSGNETYVSTTDPWKTTYYFGRQELSSQGISFVDILSKYIDGNYQNDIYFIHFREGHVSEELISKLRLKAKKEIKIGKDQAFLFKECAFEL